MDILGIGGGEVILVLIVVLLLWGPSRIVEIARTLGKIVYTLKNTTSELTTQITREVEEKKKTEAAKPSESDKS
jgi:sec-independent protein translocase protein TatA